jgi:hypothetical protein
MQNKKAMKLAVAFKIPPGYQRVFNSNHRTAWSQRKFYHITQKTDQIALSSLPQSNSIKSIVVTSTTHVPALEVVENTLVGFQYRLYFI